jgi:phospholipase/carboxylesterase
MTTALFSAPAKQSIPPQKTVDKLDLELDFVKAALPAKTRLTHPHMLFTPMHYEPHYAYPLLVWLHGTGEDERQLLRIMPVISMRNYVAVAPRGLPIESGESHPIFDLSVAAIMQRSKEQYGWIFSEDNVETIEQRVFDSIAVAQERCTIADHRIFVAGFGNGGTAALRLATQYPECFAGAASFGGELPTDSNFLPSWHMMQPLLLLLGTDKSAPDRACSMMELCYTAGFTADFREYPDTNHLTSTMLQDLNRWMMQIVCKKENSFLSAKVGQ